MYKIEAVIFDVDGLMFDTERLWLDSVIESNKLYHLNIPEELVKSCMGMRTNEIYQIFSKQLNEKYTMEEIKNLHHTFKEKSIIENGMPVKKGLVELLNYLKTKNIKIGMATSSSLDKIKFYFNYTSLNMNYFDVIVTGDMVIKPKPDPEIYLKACEKLNINSKNTIALEDSDFGIKSAYTAGLKPILIPDIKKPSEETLKLAFKKCNDLNEVIGVIEEINK